MKKSKLKKNIGISSIRLAKFRRATLIASAGASTRLEGSKLSDKEVEQIYTKVNDYKRKSVNLSGK